MRIPASRAA
ncbi:hypothetical protein YPPY98_1813, partial [Yersinia pestis PY-98]